MGLQIGGRLLIATHLDQSNYLANQQQVLCFAVPFTSLYILCTNAGSKPFCGENWHVLTFCSSDFSLQGRILITSGAALSAAKGGGGMKPHCRKRQLTTLQGGKIQPHCKWVMKLFLYAHVESFKLFSSSSSLSIGEVFKQLRLLYSHPYCRLPCFLK